MEAMEYLASPFELKAVDAETGVFSGLGSTFNNLDLHREIVMPGAFAKSLKQTGPEGVAMLWQHDTHEPIGVWTEIAEDVRGLPVTGQLLIDASVPLADKAHTLMKAKALSGLSIGYRTVKDEIDRDTGVRKLIEIKLMEISPVTFPANPKARIRRVKGIGTDEITTKRELEDALRDAGFSNSVAAYVAAGWTPPARRDVEGEIGQLMHRIERAGQVLGTSI